MSNQRGKKCSGSQVNFTWYEGIFDLILPLLLDVLASRTIAYLRCLPRKYLHFLHLESPPAKASEEDSCDWLRVPHPTRYPHQVAWHPHPWPPWSSHRSSPQCFSLRAANSPGRWQCHKRESREYFLESLSKNRSWTLRDHRNGLCECHFTGKAMRWNHPILSQTAPINQR